MIIASGLRTVLHDIRVGITAVFFMIIVTSGSIFAQLGDICIVDDNGTGTITLPPAGCNYRSPQEVFMIIDGLPPGTTIELTPFFHAFHCNNTETPGPCLVENGGSLGGQREVFDGLMVIEARGTGELAGFRRIFSFEVAAETQSAPRSPGDQQQNFDTDFFSIVGALALGDPDFALLQFVGGSAFGLTSFGHSQLTDLGDGTFYVDNFYDLNYQIAFQGAPGGLLDGLSGVTLGTTRLEARGVAPNRRCHAPDDGTGTADLPPADCSYISPRQSFMIINGLSPGTVLELKPLLYQFVCTGAGGECAEAGGILGGQRESFDATLRLNIEGTNALANFRRILRVPVSVETHSAPRSPGEAVQGFSSLLFDLQGSLSGDPDFSSLTITAGDNNGLPSPGHTTLQELPGGDFQVDSFFDITYRIDFVGAPGGQLAGLSGSTTATLRMEARHGKTDAVAPDNGSGTVNLPPESGQYVIPDDHFTVSDGLPPGTTIELDPSLYFFTCSGSDCDQPGGNLGGQREVFNATLDLEIQGTSTQRALHRSISIPLTVETHSAPRTPGDAVQIFATDIFSLQGSLNGDPDFQQLSITAGTNHGLASPGSTTLTRQAGDSFQVDSFFDIAYQIDYIGAPGGLLDGISGSTTGSARLEVCDRPAAPAHSITIVKQTALPDPTDFNFTGDLGSFSLDNDGDPTLSDRRTINNLVPGTYMVSELVPPGWQLDNISHDDPDGETTVDVGSGLATIDLDLGEAITVTFSNLCQSPPTAMVSGDAVICTGDDTEIIAKLTGNPPWDIVWSDGFVQNGVTTPNVRREVSPVSTTVYTITDLGDAFCAGLSTGSATVTVGATGELAAHFTRSRQSQGLRPISFSVDTTCAVPPITYDFITNPVTAFSVIGETMTIDNNPPPLTSTLVEVTVSDGQTRAVTMASARLLVSANSLYFDLNGDGCNNLHDLWQLALDWQSEISDDPNGDGIINILDFLYINLDDPIDCP